jgi:crotonobetainyl-CoA:carnitine CoA-transferase CaiB-like acyl-CoA transferase
LGRDDWGDDPGLATAEGRLARQDDLEAGIRAWSREREGEGIQTLLQSHGVAAHLVATTGDLEHDPQIRHRGHLWKTPHPVIGPLTYDGPAYLLSETRAAPHGPAPLMGEHNEYVYKELLGYSEAEFIELLAREVIL